MAEKHDLDHLEDLAAQLERAQGSAATKLWQQARSSLMKVAGMGDSRVADVLRARTPEALVELVRELRSHSEEAEPPQDAPPESSPEIEFDPAELKNAMRAFRKRLKLTRLNEESKLGRSPMTSGKASDVIAIMPPREFPQEVWDELERQGQLKRVGRGFYELSE